MPTHLPRTGCTHLNQLVLGWWVGRQIYDEERIIGAVPRFTASGCGSSGTCAG